ncbi:MAG: SNF2-related protein [bacterium]
MTLNRAYLDKIGYTFYSYEPFDHQYKTIDTLLRNKRCYNFSDMGSGKTASTIWAYDILRYAGRVKRLLVICPLSIMDSVWAKEVKNITPHLRYAIMHGNKQVRLQALNSDAEIVITNHDCVRTYWPEILKEKFDIIAIDELTAYKHHGSNRSKAMKKIADHSKAVWGLTGTPITTGAMDAYGLGRIVNPSRLPTPYMTKFRKLVMYQIDMYNYEHKEGWQDVVNGVLQPAIRFKLDECLDIPPITYETRSVAMSKETAKAYKAMLDEHLAQLKSGLITAVNAGVKYSKLLQIASGNVIDAEGNIHEVDVKGKLDETYEVIRQAGGKLLIFVQFVASAEFLYSRLSKDFNVKKVYGKVPVRARTEAFNSFQDGDTEILIAQVATASHGLTLTSSNYILYWGPIMGTERFLQSIARIRRAGQSKPQHIIKLESCGAERQLYKNLEEGKINGDTILAMYENL